jgi:magnesium chelatase accessory protein
MVAMANPTHTAGRGLVWERDGADWPNRQASMFVDAGGLRWHVQRMGDGPVLLLLHGTGAATHSWRGLLPLLARRFTVVAPDLPGHGFTDAPPFEQLSLLGMSESLADLLHALSLAPALAVGHSAGAAILAHMDLSNQLDARVLVSLNGALKPLGGLAAAVFQPVAKLMAGSSLLPAVLARRAQNRSAVERLLRGTGSEIDAEGIDLYARLFSNRGHAAATLGMMANWDLHSLHDGLPDLRANLVLVVSGGDRTISPEQAFEIRDRVSGARVEYVRGLGHLAHEENPELFFDIIERIARSAGLLCANERAGA